MRVRVHVAYTMPNSGHEIIHDKTIGAPARTSELINEAWNAIEKQKGTRSLAFSWWVLVFRVSDTALRRNGSVPVRAYGYTLLSGIMTVVGACSSHGIVDERRAAGDDYLCTRWACRCGYDRLSRLS